ncbi:MAG: DUF2225 domain-containing protein [Myxococcales bacterium]|jgi:uncharacterized protein (DUF2225 family)
MAGDRSKTAQQQVSRASSPPIEFITLSLRCPVCNTAFNSEIPNPGAPVARDSDLRPKFAGPDPLPSLVHCCPSCRYSAYPCGFDSRVEEVDELLDSLSRRPGDRPPTRMQSFEENDLDDLRRWIRRGSLTSDLAEGREPYGAERYVLAARCHEYVKDDDPLELADYYLRAAWCARATGQPELERESQREAIARLEAALEDSTLATESEKPRIFYLIGELSRRCGDFGKAVDLFSQLDGQNESVDADEDESVLFAALARRMLALAAVKSDVNAALPEEDLEVEGDGEAD